MARARPAVWVMCMPAPTSRKAMPAETWPIQAGTLAACAAAGENEQREGHDGEAAELDHGALVDIGHALPAQFRAVIVRLEADECPEGRKDQRDCQHDRHERGRYAQFDDHDAVERADQQHQRHANRNLKQRQPQKSRQRQIRRRGIGKGQESGAKTDPGSHHALTDAVHGTITVTQSTDMSAAQAEPGAARRRIGLQ